MTSPGHGFTHAVAAVQRLRRDLDPSRDRGSFVVVGHPKHWRATAKALRDRGDDVLAFHDLCFESRRLWCAGRPVWHGRWSGPLAGRRVVFGGPVRKRYFDGPPTAVERCLFSQPMEDWQQTAAHTPDISKHGDELAGVWASLADEASRDVFASVVRARTDGDAGFLRVSPFREYDHAIVRARPGETVIDAGAYVGDSARRFAWQMRGRGKIVALEPSPKSFQKLAGRLIFGLVPLCLGAWHESAVLSFAQDGGSSRIVDGGGTTVHVAPIDWIVRELELARVDLLKLDVEGAERQALDGSAETIRRFRPKIQLSIYHRRRDLYELPQKLSAMVQDYRFYVGHHGPYHTETDLYAIPEERIG